jgi:WD40 repeat protein
VRYFSFPGYEYPVLPAFSPCGRWLYGNAVHGLVVWDLAGTGGEPVWAEFESGGFVTRLAVGPCGRYVAGAADRWVLVWDMVRRSKAKWLLAHPGGHNITDVAFTPDGTDLLTTCVDGVGGGVRRWRVGNWHRKPPFATRTNLDDPLAISPDGATLATADKHDRVRPAIKLWRYPDGKHRKTAACDARRVVYLAYSPDGSLLAGQDEWRRVRVWDARTLAEVAVYEPPPKKGRKKLGEVRNIAFHPSGRALALTSDAAPVAFLDAATWQPVRVFDWKLGRTYGVAFSPDGALAAAGCGKGKVVVWDVDL